MEIVCPEPELYDILQKVAAVWKTEVTTDCKEARIVIPEKVGEGILFGASFQDGLSLVVFQGKLNKDLKVVWPGKKKHPLLLQFTLGGWMRHGYQKDEIQYRLNPMEGSITANPSGCEQWFRLPADTALLLAGVYVNREAYHDKVACELELMPRKLAWLFDDTEAAKPFFYQSNYSLQISSCIQEIVDNEFEGLVRSGFLESKTLEILTFQIKQYNDDLKEPGKQVLMRRSDVERIDQARALLLDNLTDPPTIIELARQVGINQQKLKKGFKELFHSTLKQFAIDQRLEIAARLIMSKDLSIREVAEQVGYANQSHFSRLFREKFGVLPRDYRKNQLTRVNIKGIRV